MKVENYKKKVKEEILPNAVYSSGEVARLIGTRKETVAQMTKDKRMYCIRPIKHRMYLGQHILDFLNEEKNIVINKQIEEIEKEKKEAVLKYILSLGWQNTENKYVKEVISDADKIAKEIY